MPIYFRTIPKSLNWLALASSVLLTFKVFFLNTIQEPVKGMYNLGLTMEGILASILASYVFYLLVVHLKEFKDKRVVYPHITKWSKAVVNDCKEQLEALSDKSGVELNFGLLNNDQLKDALSKISVGSDSPLIIGTSYANWFQYFQYHRASTKQKISDILSQIHFLDASMVPVLVKVRDCGHFSVLDILAKSQLRNNNLAPFSNTLFSYYQACYELDKYISNTPWHTESG